MVQCMVRLGNRAAALAEAARMREQLRRELGVDPLPETEHALREALGNGALSRSIAPPAATGLAAGETAAI